MCTHSESPTPLPGREGIQGEGEIITSGIDHYSWLEATPTSYSKQWERHLAAICKHFESACDRLSRDFGNTAPAR